MYNKYLVYLDDGIDVYKIAVPAVSEDEAKRFCSGSGEVIAVKDITADCYIRADKVFDTLKKSGDFTEFEVDFMVRALTDIGIIN